MELKNQEISLWGKSGFLSRLKTRDLIGRKWLNTSCSGFQNLIGDLLSATSSLTVTCKVTVDRNIDGLDTYDVELIAYNRDLMDFNATKKQHLAFMLNNAFFRETDTIIIAFHKTGWFWIPQILD